jgi:hypothetical protein
MVTLISTIFDLMAARMLVVMTTVTRLAQAVMSPSRREILGKSRSSKLQPLATDPRHGCG